MAKKIETGAAKSAPKKVVIPAKKAVPAEKPKVAPKKKGGEKKVSKVTLVTFSMKAVIPTQSFGNFQPEITVTAPTIEEARAFVLPIMEDLYQQYAEATPDGRTPKFFKKPDVVMKEKVVTPPATTQAPIKAPAQQTTPVQPQATTPPAPQATASSQKEDPDEVPFVGTQHPDAPKSPQYMKGAGMIEGTMSMEALDAVEDKVKNSIKLSSQEKDELMVLVLKKRKTFNQ